MEIGEELTWVQQDVEPGGWTKKDFCDEEQPLEICIPPKNMLG